MIRLSSIAVTAILLALYNTSSSLADSTAQALEGLSAAQTRLVGKTLISAEDAWALARDVVYKDNNKTLYCKCTWAAYDQFDGVINPQRCRVSPGVGDETAQILSWDNVVPASWFGKDLSCWKDGNPACHRYGNEYRGQACCALLDSSYMEMSVDLHNIVPAVLIINQAKSNFPTGLVVGEQRDFDECNFEVGDVPRRYEPSASIRGEIARIWLYMSDTHGMVLSPSYKQLLLRWSADDPADDWEIERSKRITALQGRINPYVQTEGSPQ